MGMLRSGGSFVGNKLISNLFFLDAMDGLCDAFSGKMDNEGID